MTTQCQLVEEPHAIGDFCWVRNGDGKVTGLEIVLPGGSKGNGIKSIWLVHQAEPVYPFWEWDGNEQTPTLKPSLQQGGPYGYHGTLTAGVLTAH